MNKTIILYPSNVITFQEKFEYRLALKKAKDYKCKIHNTIPCVIWTGQKDKPYYYVCYECENNIVNH